MLKRLFVSAAVAAGCLASALSAQAEPEFTFVLEHVLGPKSTAQTQFLEPWAKRIEEQSDGRIKIEIYPAMSLGGKPTELYSHIRDGAVDLGWSALGYTPGVYPRSEVFELPFVHTGSAAVTNMAIQEIYQDYLSQDFADIKPLLIHTHTGQAIFTTEKNIQSLADVKGMKLRAPSRTGAWMLESWGAQPVSMPVPDLPQALSLGVVDGALIPYEVAIPFKIQDMTKYSIEGTDGVRFGTLVFMFAMNKDRYEALPDDLKKVIDDNSGTHIAKEIGDAWDAIEPRGADIFAKSGEVIRLSAEETAKFEGKSDEVIDRWVAEMNDKGVDGAAIVEAARKAIAKYSNQN
ncbi:TRAP transporter substrate-binding protein [Thalassospira sp. SM2505]|uniref:C4-dicarboxylate ABC transporter substrate-binding protein n=1 Tax=Thalassospira profundimaris TaxID=502049 RepID=A0A367WY22_9PROT|nr:TRAP transporter substrate-binding protein [Thalassospira profundimaris]RCK46287.1 C4-dicarboxylate ABC transporter substrate-binding protein [Thalassospira profundimaris]